MSVSLCDPISVFLSFSLPISLSVCLTPWHSLPVALSSYHLLCTFISFYPFVSVTHLWDYTKLLIMHPSNVRWNSMVFSVMWIFLSFCFAFGWQLLNEPYIRNANLVIKLNQEIFSNESDSMLLVLVSRGWNPKEHNEIFHFECVKHNSTNIRAANLKHRTREIYFLTTCTRHIVVYNLFRYIST